MPYTFLAKPDHKTTTIGNHPFKDSNTVWILLWVYLYLEKKDWLDSNSFEVCVFIVVHVHTNRQIHVVMNIKLMKWVLFER